MRSLFQVLTDPLRQLWQRLEGEAPEALLPLLRPVPPYTGRGLFGPVASIGALLGLLILSGVALGALGTFLLALLALYILINEVLGLSVEIHPRPF